MESNLIRSGGPIVGVYLCSREEIKGAISSISYNVICCCALSGFALGLDKITLSLTIMG